MALSGTLETFSLPDVLRLLASTKKTGLLVLDGDRGVGRLWVDEGGVVAASADRAVVDEVDGVVFELLRFSEATFEFQPGVEPLGPRSDRRDVEEVLGIAEDRLAEWHEIEAVVPSLDVWVCMAQEIDGELTIGPAQWRVLARVGTGVSGHHLAAGLEQSEYDVCRQLRDLIEAGMVELDDAPAEEVPVWHGPHAVSVDPLEPSTDVAFAEPSLSTSEVSSLGADLASFVAAGTPDEPVEGVTLELVTDVDDVDDLDDVDNPGLPVEVDDAPAAPWSLEVDDEVTPTDDDAEIAGAETGAADWSDGDDGDFLSQLSHLSPKAAAAIEATASAEARGAHEDLDRGDASEPTTQPGSGGDDLDQNLLLRFLSSTKQ